MLKPEGRTRLALRPGSSVISGKGTEEAKHRSEMSVQLSVRRAAVPKARGGGVGALGGGGPGACMVGALEVVGFTVSVKGRGAKDMS